MTWERIAFTCPGHSFRVSTILRDYDIPALGATVPGYETMAWSTPSDGDPERLIYEYACQTEAKARHAHYVISKRLARLHAASSVPNETP